jgi:hypothetical protein
MSFLKWMRDWKAILSEAAKREEAAGGDGSPESFVAHVEAVAKERGKEAELDEIKRFAQTIRMGGSK